MKKKLLLKLFIFVFLGALFGFLFYFFVGCRTGSCPITSNPYISVFYGILMGAVLGYDSRLIRP